MQIEMNKMAADEFDCTEWQSDFLTKLQHFCNSYSWHFVNIILELP